MKSGEMLDACSFLLGRPWQFDTDAIHYGRSNKYNLMHNGKKIVLLPMTLTEILQFENEKKNNAKQKGVSNSKNQQPIKLKILFCLQLNLILMNYLPLLDLAML
jgi:hypothetical protein